MEDLKRSIQHPLSMKQENEICNHKSSFAKKVNDSRWKALNFFVRLGKNGDRYLLISWTTSSHKHMF